MIIHDFAIPQTRPTRQFQLSANQQLLLMPVGDVHALAEGWPKQRFREHILWGLERGAYFLGMGDYFDFTSTSQRLLLRQMRTSQQNQLGSMVREQVAGFVENIKESKGRWLGLLEGHHYYEFEDGTTSDQELCRLLGCPFLGTSTLLNLRLNRTEGHATGTFVTVYAHHGLGGSGRRQGTGLLRLEDLLMWIEADIYLMAHIHTKVSAQVPRLYRTQSGHLYHRTKIIARTGGWLRAYMATAPVSTGKPAQKSRGTYVEQKALPPTSLGGLVISIGWKRLSPEGVRHGHGPETTVPDLHYSV